MQAPSRIHEILSGVPDANLADSESESVSSQEEVKPPPPTQMDQLSPQPKKPDGRKKPRTEAQKSQIQQAQKSAYLRRKERQQKQEADRISLIAQETARILGEQKKRRKVRPAPVDTSSSDTSEDSPPTPNVATTPPTRRERRPKHIREYKESPAAESAYHAHIMRSAF